MCSQGQISMISHDFDWQDEFNENYYENGTKTGVSLYENYSWKPELSFPMACELKILYPNYSILDFGCAKGYLVHALRKLNVEAYGFEVSRYAISKVFNSIKPFIYTPEAHSLPQVDLVFVKDTLEHINESSIRSVLRSLHDICKEMFVIVPFGENGQYRINEYNKDKTHVICRNEAWWKNTFLCSHFKIEKFTYRFRGFKDNWHRYKYGNGFFKLIKNS